MCGLEYVAYGVIMNVVVRVIMSGYECGHGCGVRCDMMRVMGGDGNGNV